MKKGIGRGLGLAVLVGALCLGLGSCSRQVGRPRQVGEGPRSTSVPGARQSREGGQPTDGLAARPLPERPRAEILPPGPRAPDAPRYLNLQAPPVAAIASDFSLGPLEGRFAEAGGGRPPGLVESLSAFLDAVVAGKTPASSLLEGREALVGAILGSLPEAGKPGHPRSWRLGAITVDVDEAVAPLAFFADRIDPSGPTRLPPRCEGLIHARLVGGQWLIEDLSFDPTGLLADRSLPDPPWNPPSPGDQDH